MSDLFADTPHAPVHLPGVSKGWIPADYMDESCPPCRPTPSDWLEAGDVLRLARADEDADEDCVPGRVVAENDTVRFSQLTEYPSVKAVWHGPGDYRFLSPIPAGATTFWIPFDPDTIDASAEDVMRHGQENGAFEPGEELEIGAYDWSDQPFVLRAGRFISFSETKASAHD